MFVQQQQQQQQQTERASETKVRRDKSGNNKIAKNSQK
jgi:hypothetical protein